jgi:plasmid stability protein
MAAITIRDIDPEVKERLRVRAATNGRSMEAEARSIIDAAVSGPFGGMNIAQAFRKVAVDLGGLDDVPWPSRNDEPDEGPPVFSDEWEAERAEDLEDQASEKRKVA